MANLEKVKRIINELNILCRDHNSHGKHNLVAGCYNKKMNLVSMGFNNYNKTHPKQYYYGNKSGNSDKCFMHAELTAIINARGVPIDTIVICRYTNAARLAKPCPSCMLAIKDAGIKNIFYTISDNEIGYIEV